MDLLTPSSCGDLPTLSWTTKGSWLPWERVARPLVSPLTPVPWHWFTNQILYYNTFGEWVHFQGQPCHQCNPYAHTVTYTDHILHEDQIGIRFMESAIPLKPGVPHANDAGLQWPKFGALVSVHSHGVTWRYQMFHVDHSGAGEVFKGAARLQLQEVPSVPSNILWDPTCTTVLFDLEWPNLAW